MMALYAWAGKASAPLRQYALRRETLAEEFGLEPSQETTALYEQIRSGQLDPPGPAPGAALLEDLPSRNLPAQPNPFIGRARERDLERFDIACPPEQFGLGTLYGLWFVRGNVLRDFAALNEAETVPFLIRPGKDLTWDAWRLVAAADDEILHNKLALLDTVAELSLDADKWFDKIGYLYTSHKEL